VLVVGWYLSKVAVRIAGRTVARRIERPSVTRTALRGVRAAVLLWAAVVAASILGVGDTQILLSVTVISAVIAVVLAPVVGSLINGLYVLADRPYEIGDMIEVSDAGHRGFVEDITIRYTKIFTLQNTFIVIPNSEIHARDVINYSAEDERTRVSLRLDITYESDLEAARKATEQAARGVDDVISGGPDIPDRQRPIRRSTLLLHHRVRRPRDRSGTVLLDETPLQADRRPVGGARRYRRTVGRSRRGVRLPTPPPRLRRNQRRRTTGRRRLAIRAHGRGLTVEPGGSPADPADR